MPLFKTEFASLLQDAEGWNRDKLGRCSVRQLQVLAVLLNASKGGTKAALIARLLAVRDLRVMLSKIVEPTELVEAYKLKELKAMCKTAKIWQGCNKLSAAAQLLTWRNRCRISGKHWLQGALTKMRKEASA